MLQINLIQFSIEIKHETLIEQIDFTKSYATTVNIFKIIFCHHVDLLNYELRCIFVRFFLFFCFLKSLLLTEQQVAMPYTITQMDTVFLIE